jgi:hypothetical protein
MIFLPHFQSIFSIKISRLLVDLCFPRKNSITALSDLPLSWLVVTAVDVVALPLPNLYFTEAE